MPVHTVLHLYIFHKLKFIVHLLQLLKLSIPFLTSTYCRRRIEPELGDKLSGQSLKRGLQFDSYREDSGSYHKQ